MVDTVDGDSDEDETSKLFYLPGHGVFRQNLCRR